VKILCENLQGGAKKFPRSQGTFSFVPHEIKKFFIKKSTSKRKEILMGAKGKVSVGTCGNFFAPPCREEIWRFEIQGVFFISDNVR
jgi:hypothetical protein